METHALSAAINRRIYAEARLTAGRTVLWHCLGVASLVALAGAGVAAGLIGYSCLTDARPAAEQVAQVLSKALAETQFKAKASGEVALAEGGEVSLARGAVVKVDPRTRLKLDPDASIKAEATLTQPRLSDRQLQPEAVAPSGAVVNTNYTIFKIVPFGSGSVSTGWSYSNSEDVAPVYQYCYYKQSVDEQAVVNIQLGDNGVYTPPKSAPGVDALAAYRSCQWYHG